MLNEQTFKNLSKQWQEPSWLLERRKEAFEQFKESEMPSFKYGIGIFVDVSDLDLNAINPLDDKNEDYVVKSEVAEILSFQEALQKYPDILEEFFFKKGELYENKLTALHSAFFTQGLVIRIPKNATLNKPIQIYEEMKASAKISTILIVAEPNSKAVVIEALRSINDEQQRFRSQEICIIVKENAQIEYKTIQNVSKSTYHFSQRKASVARKGIIHWIDCYIGGKLTQAKTKTFLDGEGAETKSFGITFGDQTQCFDINYETTHKASKTNSNMLTKVVLNDKAKIVYRGLIKIAPLAIGCEGYQKDDTILLSENAHADSVPNLEIANNDVKCSHGATISQIDEEKLFYMKSRGLDEKTSKKMIVEGFFDPIIIKIEDEALQDEIKNKISERLGALC